MSLLEIIATLLEGEEEVESFLKAKPEKAFKVNTNPKVYTPQKQSNSSKQESIKNQEKEQ